VIGTSKSRAHGRVGARLAASARFAKQEAASAAATMVRATALMYGSALPTGIFLDDAFAGSQGTNDTNRHAVASRVLGFV